MKVKELIAQLGSYDPELEVRFSYPVNDHCGHTISDGVRRIEALELYRGNVIGYETWIRPEDDEHNARIEEAKEDGEDVKLFVVID